MTDNEVIYAAGEVIQQLEESVAELAKRFNGRIVKAYGGKVFRVDEADYAHGDICVRGFVLKKNGEPGVRRYGVPVGDVEYP